MKTRVVGILLLLVCLALIPLAVSAQEEVMAVEAGDVEVVSGGLNYLSYLAAPSEGGPFPAIVLVHSNRGLEEGYKTMVDQLAAEGFVVLALGWQTNGDSPDDATVKTLIEDSVAMLSEREDVDAERLGLTGFCAGGRYTMLMLPQIQSFKAGVAWYGFPTRGAPAAQDLVGDLTAPMLIIHGTADSPSPIADIYGYATSLTEAGKYFEMKVYYGEPHGFMLDGGQLRDDDVASDAFAEMADFFKRKLA